MTANTTQTRRKRGGQKGNGNARKHGFYSGTLSPADTCQLWNIANLEGVDPEIALIRVKLQSSLQHDPGNRRVIREASRLLVRRYFAEYGLDPSDRKYLKAVVESLLETASMHQSAGLQSSQKQMADDETNRMYPNNLIGHLTYGKELLNFRKTGDFHKTNHPSFAASVRRPARLAKPDSNPAKRIVGLSGLSVPEVIALRIEKSRPTLGKQVIPTKRIVPDSLLLSLMQLL